MNLKHDRSRQDGRRKDSSTQWGSRPTRARAVAEFRPLRMGLTTPASASADSIRPGSLSSLPRRTYRFRTLGMGLAMLPLAAVLMERDAHWVNWAWVVFTGVLWPHLAYLHAIRSRDPFKAELRNFVIDSMIAGSWVPLMHFNVLPSAVLLTVVTADKVNSGVRGLWLRSLPGLIAVRSASACSPASPMRRKRA